MHHWRWSCRSSRDSGVWGVLQCPELCGFALTRKSEQSRRCSSPADMMDLGVICTVGQTLRHYVSRLVMGRNRRLTPSASSSKLLMSIILRDVDCPSSKRLKCKEQAPA
jgi:hypothetical protein